MTDYLLPTLIPIPAGPFLLGSDVNDAVANENEKPRHSVELPFYQIGKYPITNEEYAYFVNDTSFAAPSHWQETTPPSELLDHPVVNISLIAASSYCEWLSQKTGMLFALPTEEQWEKAARGAAPDMRQYVWGDAWKPDVCNTEEAGIGTTTAVTLYEDVVQSPYGVIDMLGNVWEWTKSYYERFPGSSHESLHYGNAYHIIRGGSWNNGRSLARCANRGRYLPGTKRLYLGFRVITYTSTENLQPKNIDNPHYDKKKINKQLTKAFNMKELRDLCFYFDIEHENFSQKKDEFCQELIGFFERRERLIELLEYLKNERPNIK